MTSPTDPACAAPGLAACADEPIRIPGAIQPHGRLLAIDADAGHLLAYSDNWPDPSALDAILAGLPLARTALPAGDAPAPLGRVRLDCGECDASFHRMGHAVFVEFEPAGPDTGTQAPIYSLARHFLPAVQRSGSIEALCQLAVREVKRLTGFGRCLAYRFDEQGHGEVLAELADPGYDCYAGHRFPATDIPPQARELYLTNFIRVIPDADYTPVPLRCIDPAGLATRLDLSMATLRSVSPVHLEYMRNMGTRASMSISIVAGGRLWGLVSGHDRGARQLSYQTRAACEHLGRLLSIQVEATDENNEVARRLELRKLTLQIVSQRAELDASLLGLVEEPAPLLRLTRASGAAIVLNDTCRAVGDTPPAAGLIAVSRWLANHASDSYSTERLAGELPEAEAWQSTCAGLLALSISQVNRHHILWFRPPVQQTIRWAGQPGKEVSDAGRIHPRRSFASWLQEVGDRSLPWMPSEVAATLELRQSLIGIVLRRAEELAEVAGELGRVNKELEAFSYTVSHDLRAPMRHISGYVDLVLDIDGEHLGERARRYLAHVKDASAFAGQLVDGLLDFSRMGRSALKRSRVDIPLLVNDLVREFSRVESRHRIEWDVARDLPLLWADPLLIQLAIRNLVGNAVKYSRERDVARIRIAAVRRAGAEGLEVSDNGAGFEMKYVGKLFGVFQRLHASEEFEGTGIGLASVRRIVERHGGEVWAEGKPGEGARFGFVLPVVEEKN